MKAFEQKNYLTYSLSSQLIFNFFIFYPYLTVTTIKQIIIFYFQENFYYFKRIILNVLLHLV